MPTVIDCPSCGRKLRVADDLLSARVKCPTCGSDFAAPSEAHGPPPVGEDPRAAARGLAPRRCPYCREGIEAGADCCRHCGEELDDEDVPPWERGRGVRRDCEPHRGGLILALGVTGLVAGGIPYCILLGLPISLAAWLLGRQDLGQIRSGQMDPEGESMTQAGRVCGIIGTALSLFWLVGLGLYLALEVW